MERRSTGAGGVGEPPAWIARGRIPGLDGLRAVSILLVLASHAALTHGFPGPRPGLDALRRLGGLGVDVFFVISGFLITLLLLRERDRTGSISLRGFYARRALRIVPAYAAYLLFVLALTRLGAVALSPRDWAAALSYTVNFLPDLEGRWTIGHLWSLSIEEHFYLVWPPALLWLGRKRGPMALVAAIAAAPALRVVVFRAGLGANAATPARIDTIGMGCLLAFVVTDRRTWPAAARVLRRADAVVVASAIALVASCVWLSSVHRYWLTVERSVEAALIAAIVLACAAAPGSRVGRLLNARPVAALGTLSYSLYLWQQPFLDPTMDRPMTRWPGNVALAVLAALGSYYLVERPFLKIKDRPRPGTARGAAGTGRVVVGTAREARAGAAVPSLDRGVRPPR